MLITLLIFGGLLAMLYGWYAGIVTKKNKVFEALSGIDVQLKKRSNLIPNILEIAKKFMAHEKELLTKITELREKIEQDYDTADAAKVKQHLKDAGALDQSMGQFMIQVENYPDLKSDATMLQAQQTYNEVEEHIAAARRFYNASVTDLNNAIQIFPGNLLAGYAGAKEMPFYEADDSARQPISAADILNA